MVRAKWKGPFLIPLPRPASPAEPVRTQARSSTIIASQINKKFLVHNGKDYVPVFVTEQMVGRKLGEFAFTRKAFSFKKKDDKKRFICTYGRL
ncbi:mitochondrial ribosomal small subunit component [Geranomyces variabilis]|nr:mitochondrial ribosomal small subunit component [Geranomyces variabilis]